MPKLIISGVTHELVDEAITIGRGPDNTIVVNDPSISTHHAQLLLEGDTYRLKDLDSTNGTRVNGKPVTETVLRFDDRIRFGAAEARYESSEAVGSKPLPKPRRSKLISQNWRGAAPFERAAFPSPPETTERPSSQRNFYRPGDCSASVSRKPHRGVNDARAKPLSCLRHGNGAEPGFSKANDEARMSNAETNPNDET